MNVAPLPVMFEPLLKPKPWGGRRLATLFGRHLPGVDPIGESWELADLPGNESRVRGGPLDGTSLRDLVQRWGRSLLGDAELVDGRFPLLVKFLDASQNVSVQVHPKPATEADERTRTSVGKSRQRRAAVIPSVKHEAWYVVYADPGAKLYIGLKPGVGPEDVRRAGSTAALVDLLRVWDASPGECYYLPSGTPHALGAGVVVAEVQTPSDVTYRLYDWGRVGLDGRPRELHVDEALANIRYDVTAELIRPSPSVAPLFAERAAAGASPAEERSTTEAHAVRLVGCDCFLIDRLDLSAGAAYAPPAGSMSIWIMVSGSGRMRWAEGTRPQVRTKRGATGRRAEGKMMLLPGDVVLIPALGPETRIEPTANCTALRVSIPR